MDLFFCDIKMQHDFKSAVLNGIKQSGKILDCHIIRIDGYWVPKWNKTI